ncbi:MAG: 1-deoxy-D-xylulose-5-phosphate synthase [Peptococcaceae bacterium]|jgi:1-deoxy-D-xylulose-5-phosphate synthase|nr:1-deoxy-D-xylulose-5-phosphate synthase [Peptococcaceae bacterium]
MGLLEGIHGPEDLRSLNLRQRQELAQEIRRTLIEVVAANGGHLAPNLGVVELTIALHRVFNSPNDKLVWDVGHQSYVHKMLTGRLAQIRTLRQWQGLSGFPRREESPHDCFSTGHSSTSISAAMGFATARDLRGEKHYVIAVIGDGAMTGGMVFEALNHAGQSGTNLIVILNDNEMSISQNVGALSQYLNRLRSDPHYAERKKNLKNTLQRIPAIGSKTVQTARKVKKSLKYMLVPGLLFEELGFTYLGPLDGHDEAILEKILIQAKQKKGPVLLHVITSKGKGYEPAEQNPDVFHGVGPFDPLTGELKAAGTKPSFTQVFGEALNELAQGDPEIVAITAAMSSGTGLSLFAQNYPARFFDVGIAEQHAVTFATALACSGYKPVVALYSTFMQRACDQILHDVCMQNAHVFLALDRAGVVGDDGSSHHGIFDISLLRAAPNLVIMAPKDGDELRHMLYTGLLYNGPVCMRYPRGEVPVAGHNAAWQEIPIGQAEVLREGRDVTLCALGPLAYMCLTAATELRRRRIEAGVINLRFAKPLDKELILRLAIATKHLIILEDQILSGGVGSAVLELLAEEGLTDVQVERIGYAGFVEHGSIAQLHEQYDLTVEGIIKAVERMRLSKRRIHTM